MSGGDLLVLLILVLSAAALVAALFGFVAAVNWLQFGQFVLTPTLREAPLASPEAVRGHSDVLPLLRASCVLAPLVVLALAAARLTGLPLLSLLGAALPLAASIVPITWAERRHAASPATAVQAVVLLATAGGVLALLNLAALARGGGPDAWLAFLQKHLADPGRAFVMTLPLILLSLVAWGVPCGLATDVRVNERARPWLGAFIAILVLQVSAPGLLVLELAYRLAARLDRHLTERDPDQG